MQLKSFVRPARIVAVVMVAGMVLAAAGGSAGASSAQAKPKKGGVFNFLFNAEVPGFDPIQLREVPQISPAFVANALFDQLVYTDPTTLKVKPKMATSLTTSDKGLTWVMKLHSGIRFSDGTPLDAAAVQFNWQRVADPANKVAFAQAAQEISTYETPDPLTLKLTLKAADPIWDQLVARNLATIGSPTALKANQQQFAQSKPVGAGPFLLKDRIAMVSTTLVRNPDYWQKGKPYVDEIDMKYITDDEARYNTVATGGAQAALDGAWTNITRYQSTGKFNIVNTPANGGGYAIAFNMTKAPFNDIRVRQAIELVLDSKEIIQRTGDGDDTWVVKTVDEKFSPFYNSKLKVKPADPVAAQKLIDAYVAENGGKPISFTYLGLNTPVHVRIANTFQTILTSKLKNVNVTLDIQNSVVGVPRQAAGDFQITLQGPRWTDPSLDDWSWFNSKSSLNYMRYSNPAVDAATTSLLTAADIKTKTELHNTVIENVLKDVPVVWIERFRTFYAVDKTLKGWSMFYELRPLFEDVWLSKPQG